MRFEKETIVKINGADGGGGGIWLHNTWKDIYKGKDKYSQQNDAHDAFTVEFTDPYGENIMGAAPIARLVKNFERVCGVSQNYSILMMCVCPVYICISVISHLQFSSQILISQILIIISSQILISQILRFLLTTMAL